MTIRIKDIELEKLESKKRVKAIESEYRAKVEAEEKAQIELAIEQVIEERKEEVLKRVLKLIEVGKEIEPIVKYYKSGVTKEIRVGTVKKGIRQEELRSGQESIIYELDSLNGIYVDRYEYVESYEVEGLDDKERRKNLKNKVREIVKISRDAVNYRYSEDRKEEVRVASNNYKYQRELTRVTKETLKKIDELVDVTEPIESDLGTGISYRDGEIKIIIEVGE